MRILNIFFFLEEYHCLDSCHVYVIFNYGQASRPKKIKRKKSGHNRNARVLMPILNLRKENLAYWNPL
jgi:hypothetical protein